MPLRLADRLALDRTVLANERTLLAHIRTALGLLGGGVAMAHLLDAPALVGLGAGIAVLSPLQLGFGVWRFRRVRRRLAAMDAEG